MAGVWDHCQKVSLQKVMHNNASTGARDLFHHGLVQKVINKIFFLWVP